MTRGQRGRRDAKRVLAVGVVMALLGPGLFILAPGMHEPTFVPRTGPAWEGLATLAVAAAGTLGGLAWMWRIYRADPEPDQQAWRYRAPRD